MKQRSNSSDMAESNTVLHENPHKIEEQMDVLYELTWCHQQLQTSAERRKEKKNLKCCSEFVCVDEVEANNKEK